MGKKYAVAVKCIIESEKGVLILKKTSEESKQDLGSNLYDIPGGRVEYGEELLEALIREIKEETDLEIDNECITLMDARNIVRPDGLNLVILYYHCQSENTNVKISEEHEDFIWIQRDKINDAIDIPEWIKDLLKDS